MISSGNENTRRRFGFILLELKRVLTNKNFIAEIDVTNQCDLSCSHCYSSNNKGLGEPSTEAWFDFFNRLHRKGIRAVLLVGGEPSLRMEILELAVKKFRFVDVITNGQKKIPLHFPVRIFLSIDGDSETNDRIRGKGTFNKAMHNYQNDKRVTLNFTITKDNYSQLENVIKIAIQNNFSGVSCNVITPNINSNPDQLINESTRNNIIQLLIKLKQQYSHQLLLSKKMIQWYEQPDHKNYCYWKKHVLHYNSVFEPKYCFADLDCSQCGCYAGASFSTRFFWG